MNPRNDTDIVLITPTRYETLCGVTLPQGGSIAASDLDLPNIDYPTSARIPEASYWRLAAPALLQGQYRRILYLDIDVLPINARLFECFDYEMGSAPLAACRSPFHFSSERRRNGKVTDGEFLFDRYFNSGVQLINVEAYVGQHVAERTFDVIRRLGPRLGMHDQTALNIAVDGNWVDLSLAYNFWPGALGSFLESHVEPRILHYHGWDKPWHLMSAYRSNSMRRKLLAFLASRGALRLMLSGPGVYRTWRRRRRSDGTAFITPDNIPLMEYLRSDFIDSFAGR